MSHLLFEVAGRRFATTASTVRRVARRGRDPARFWEKSDLGAVQGAERGLVALVEDGEEALGVDRILGVLPEARVHVLPLIAAQCLPAGSVAGVVENDDELLPLIDLAALLRARIAWRDEREGSDGAERGAHDPGAQAQDPQADGR